MIDREHIAQLERAIRELEQRVTMLEAERAMDGKAMQVTVETAVLAPDGPEMPAG
jgi:hypothetical protein